MSLMPAVISEDYPDYTSKGVAPCATTDAEIFFPDTGEGGLASANAKKICKTMCPYTIECLTYALNHPEEQGIWGGTTYRERIVMRRNMTNRPRMSRIGLPHDGAPTRRKMAV